MDMMHLALMGVVIFMIYQLGKLRGERDKDNRKCKGD